MNLKVKIAVDAMGGEGSPKKIIDGIKLSLEDSKENFFQIYGDKNLINSLHFKIYNDFVKFKLTYVVDNSKLFGS